MDAWFNGIEYQGTLNESQVTIELEKDPHEVLKMGTYVGSCYGLGGIFAFSSAAVALDVNKQVLYLRDANRKVIARQKLAIDTSVQLVCFEVYPVGIGEEIEQHFATYNIAFAEALGCEIYQDDKDPEIEHILSRDWYADSSWNPKDAKAEI